MTETLFGGDGMSAGEGGFDAWDPKNIANVVAFLAAPASADVNGQILVVFGGSIYAMSAFKAAGQVTRDAAWSPEELIAAKGDLFKGISSGVPDFSFIVVLDRDHRHGATAAAERLGTGALGYGGGVVTEQALGVEGATAPGHEHDTPAAVDTEPGHERGRMTSVVTGTMAPAEAVETAGPRRRGARLCGVGRTTDSNSCWARRRSSLSGSSAG